MLASPRSRSGVVAAAALLISAASLAGCIGAGTKEVPAGQPMPVFMTAPKPGARLLDVEVDYTVAAAGQRAVAKSVHLHPRPLGRPGAYGAFFDSPPNICWGVRPAGGEPTTAAYFPVFVKLTAVWTFEGSSLSDVQEVPVSRQGVACVD